MQAVRVARRLRDSSRWSAGVAFACAAVAAAGSVASASEARAESALVARQQHHQRHHWTSPVISSSVIKQQLPVCADVRQHYRIDNELGRGGFGLVHLGRDKQSDEAVAIKRVCKQTTSKDKFLQEVEILRAMGGRHNIVGLCEAFETKDAYVLVTELVDGQELFDHLVSNGVFTQSRAQTLTRDIAQTLAYLHSNGVVHGDLKPENILLSRKSSMRLIDFGQSFREHISSERTRCMGSGVATVAYAAPEVLSQHAKNSSRTPEAGSAIDMWGLGVVLYIVLCGYHPFDPQNDASDSELAKRIRSGRFETQSAEWKTLAPQARDLIQKLLQVEPTERITAEEALTHEWLQAADAMSQ